jgi:hypothetical protein
MTCGVLAKKIQSLRWGFETASIRSHLKNRILVQGRGGAEFQTGGILEYFEDLKRGTNKDIGPKDIFEIASRFSTDTDTW